MRDQRLDITMDFTKIEMIIRGDFGQCYFNDFND